MHERDRAQRSGATKQRSATALLRGDVALEHECVRATTCLAGTGFGEQRCGSCSSVVAFGPHLRLSADGTGRQGGNALECC